MTWRNTWPWDSVLFLATMAAATPAATPAAPVPRPPPLAEQHRAFLPIFKPLLAERTKQVRPHSITIRDPIVEDPFLANELLAQ